jgi:hypothetical protein
VVGAGATRYATVPELSYARRRATRHVALPELLRALVAGAGATRHVAALELPYARRREPQDMWACVPVLPFVFDLKLIHGVPALQGKWERCNGHGPAFGAGSGSRQ